ncbi:MAG: HlyD family efflux transporter periplasmic adaptor subunit [Proteobacteria bacterium]|nr:HlyD family efflux transporter periplasmic adaptor subunit [Pseudomonadota bacterium]
MSLDCARRGEPIWRRLAAANLALVVLAGGGCHLFKPSEDVSLQGVVEFEESLLSFEIPGRISTIHAARGQWVEAGDAIAELDPTLERIARDGFEARLRAARARLALLASGPRNQELATARAGLDAATAAEAAAKRELKLAEALQAERIGSLAQVDRMRDRLAVAVADRVTATERLALAEEGSRTPELQAAQAEVDLAASQLRLSEARLARHVLRAPAAGEIADLAIAEGEVVGAGRTIARLVDWRLPYVDVFVPQHRMTGIKLGQSAQVNIDAQPSPFSANVSHISPRTEFTPRYLFSAYERFNLVVRVRLSVQDPERALVAGVPAFANWGGPSEGLPAETPSFAGLLE